MVDTADDGSADRAFGDALEVLGTGAVVAEAPGLEQLWVSGADARAFLHRMSSQHVSEREPGDGCLNVFVDKKGRMKALVHHLTFADDRVLLLGWAHEEGALQAWLESFIFVEQVELAPASLPARWVIGAGAGTACDAVVSGSSALERWAYAGDEAALCVRTFDFVDGSGASVPAFLGLSPQAPVGTPVDARTLEALRVAAGIPVGPGEVSDRINPLELALHDAIHWAKGCYIGQEVISRIDNYDKQARHLLALVSDDAVHANEDISIDGKVVGTVTSVGAHRAGLPAALALIKTKTPDEALAVAVGEGQVSARAVARAAVQQPHD